MAREFRAKDEGKHVMTADGDMIGTVDAVSGGKAHISPDDDLSTSIRQKLGWTKTGETTYPLSSSNVAEIKDDGIHLKRDF